MNNRRRRGAIAVWSVLLLVGFVTAAVMPGPEAVRAEGVRWRGGADISMFSAIFRVGGGIDVPEGETEDDVIAIGGPVTIDGEVDGDVVSVGSSVEVNGTVRGDVMSTGGPIRLGPAAVVTGDVTTVGGRLTRAEGAQVYGEVNDVSWSGGWNFIVPSTMTFGMESGAFRLGSALFGVVAAFALAVIFMAVVPQSVRSIGEYAEGRFGRSFGIGILASVLLIPLSLILVITLIGTPLLWLGFIAAAFLGYVSIAWLIGERINQRYGMQWAEIWTLLLGVALLSVIRAIPVLGGIATVVVGMVAVGAVLGSRFGTNKPWFPPRPE